MCVDIDNSISKNIREIIHLFPMENYFQLITRIFFSDQMNFSNTSEVENRKFSSTLLQLFRTLNSQSKQKEALVFHSCLRTLGLNHRDWKSQSNPERI